MVKGLGSECPFLGEPKLHSEATDSALWVPQAEVKLSVN
jgi:hypothetical protein